MLKVEEISTFITDDINSERKRKAALGQRYYEGKHDILNYKLYYYNSEGKLIEDTTRSNIKISHPFFTELVDQCVQYMLSGKESFVKSKDSNLQAELDKYFDDDFKAELSDTLTDVCAGGFGYMYSYKNADDRTAFVYADAMGVVEVRAKDTDDHAEYIIYWYIDRIDKGKKKVKRIQVWDKTNVTYYAQIDNGKIELDQSEPVNPRPHIVYTKDDEEGKFGDSLGYIPFFRMDSSRKQVSHLKPIKALIDDYDLMACGMSNNLQDISEGLYVVKGFQGENLEEMIQNIKTKKHIGVEPDGDVDIKTIDIPHEARKAKLDIDEKNIYRFGMGFNSAQLGDGNITNIVTLQAYALSKGIEKSTSEMTNQEKIGLAMEMFLEKTEYAAGNYAKENETLAGSLATAKAALTNFLDGSGDVDSLVDSFVNAANVIVNSLNKILPRLVKGISDLITKLVPQLPPLLQTLLPAVIEGAVSLVNGLVDALPTILNALIDALPAFIDGIQKVFDALVKALPTIMRTLCDALPILIPQLVDALIGMLVTLMTMLPQIIQPIIDNLPEIIISIVDALMQNLPLLIEGLVALTIGIVQAIPQIIMALIEALPTVITSILEGLWNALPVFLQGLVSIFGNIGQALWDIVSGIWHGLGGIFSGVGEWFSTNIGEPIKNVFSGAWNALKNGASNAWNGIKNVFGSVADWFKNIFSKAWQAVKNVFSTGGKIFDGIKDGIVNAFKTVVNAIIKGINKVIAVPFNAINKLLSKLKSIDILGVKPFGWINTFNVPQIPLLRKGGVLKKGQTGFLEGDGDEAVVPLEKNTGWIRNVAERIHQFVNIDTKTKVDNSVPTNQIATVIRTEIGSRIGNLENLVASVIAVLQEYFPQLLEAFDVQIVLNDGTLVAKLTPKIDRELGMILQRKKRGMD